MFWILYTYSIIRANIFDQMWWKLQGQSVRAVPVPQQLQLCRASRAHRSRGHRRSAHPCDPGSRNLLHTQVGTVGISDYQYDHILLDLIEPPSVTCRMLKAKQQRQQSTPQQYWRVKPRVWSFSWFSHRWESLLKIDSHFNLLWSWKGLLKPNTTCNPGVNSWFPNLLYGINEWTCLPWFQEIFYTFCK